MKLRTFTLLVSLAALGLGAALWRERSASAGLAAQVTRLARKNADLRYEAKQAAAQAENFSRHAVELDSQLGSAKSRTTATEVRQHQLTRELSAREQREVELMTELATLKQRLTETAAPVETARGEVAAAPDCARAPVGHSLGDGRTPPASRPAEPAVIDLRAHRTRITELEQQLTQLLTRVLAEPAATPVAEPESAPPEPYQVVRVGPRDSFVVLDFGAAHGARPGQILRLWRGTSELARVQISDARSRFSLAQVLSTTLKGQLQTGDYALLTN
ncbi:MAG: hypothetical protein PSV13_18260 [Lacunisphaera sp.]|nr:hypothetical protein [Lacunisphaera sp.]